MSQDTLALFAAVGSVVSAIASALIALAAFKSAAAASDTVKRSALVERRALVRQLVISAHGVVAEEGRVAALTEELKHQYTTLFTLAGQFEASLQKQLVERAEQKKQEVSILQLDAKKLIDESTFLTTASEDDLTQAVAKFDGYLVRVRGIREELQREVDSVAAQQNHIFRAKAINRAGPT
jgi:hypothetical protein